MGFSVVPALSVNFGGVSIANETHIAVWVAGIIILLFASIVWCNFGFGVRKARIPSFHTRGQVSSGHCIEHRIIGGFPSELVWSGSVGRASGASSASPLIVVIPGFPGGAQIYADFLEVLAAEALCPAVCVAWCGHHTGPFMPPRSLDLTEQATFVTSVLRELRASPSVTEVVLVGHSLGCRFAAHALATLDAEQGIGAEVIQVHLLCPVFEDLALIPRAQKLIPKLLAVRAHHWETLIRGMSLVIPVWAGARVLQFVWWLRGKTTLAVEERWFYRVLVAHVRAGVLGRGLAVAIEAWGAGAMQAEALEALRGRASKVVLRYGEGDRWTPDEVRARHVAPAGLPHARQTSHAMPHGIVTCAASARRAARELGEDVSAARGGVPRGGSSCKT